MPRHTMLQVATPRADRYITGRLSEKPISEPREGVAKITKSASQLAKLSGNDSHPYLGFSGT